MDPDTELKLQIYRHTAQATRPPSVQEMASASGRRADEVREAYQRLYQKRVLVLEDDGETIRMAPPFSAVETQHRVRSGGKEYFANCAWDALAIPAALRSDGEVLSRCEQTLEPLRLRVRGGRVEGDSCVAHYAVPAAHWWDDIVYT